MSDEVKKIPVAPRQEWEVDAFRAVDNNLMADLVSDFRRPLSRSASFIPDTAREPEVNNQGWADPAPLKPPPGISYIDKMCDEQDRADRAAAIRQRIETDWIEAHFERGGPRIESEYNPFDKNRLGHDDE